jgi:hypothetical protein
MPHLALGGFGPVFDLGKQRRLALIPRWKNLFWHPENYFRCDKCGGFIDARDRVWLDEHQQPLPHPAQDQAQ